MASWSKLSKGDDGTGDADSTTYRSLDRRAEHSVRQRRAAPDLPIGTA
jgi:hypothetical protein